MLIKVSISEQKLESLKEKIPEIEFEHNTGEASIRSCLDVNLWYVLEEEHPDVVYFRKDAGPQWFRRIV